MAREQKEYRRKEIRACIYSIRDGLTEIEHVDFIRIKSRRYSLLIMEDYMPMLGELEGSLSIQAEGRLYEWPRLKGYYIHQKNLFRLMIKEAWEEQDELPDLSDTET